MRRFRFLLLVLPLCLVFAAAPDAALERQLAQSSSEGQSGGVTGLPLPRFVSLRADEVNLRTGPGIRYPIDWVYQRRGLPVEVIDEFEAWRRIRDRQGTSGWVHQSMLAADRTGVILGERRALRREAQASAAVVAWLEPGVIVLLDSCDGGWCHAEAQDGEQQSFQGWLQQSEFWGAYPGEAWR